MPQRSLKKKKELTIPDFRLADLPLIWSSLTPKQQNELRNAYPEADAIVDGLTWMREWTKTKDDQDQIRPYKPFPGYEYFDVLHKLWLREPFLFVEKSRTMMASWWAAAETLHYVMTHQPSKGIFWAQDEDRSIALLNYAWTLYDLQEPILKDIYPLSRPRDRQSFKNLKLAEEGLLVALPGKDPNKIRSEHPTVLVIDEACFIENGGEAFDVELASRVPRVLVISSAAPSWFRRMTKSAIPEPLPI